MPSSWSGPDAVGAAWRGRYDSLRLDTPRELSGLPGLPIPREMTRSEYTNGILFAGRRVLVVGSGNTGTDVAVDMVGHGAASVWIAVRTPPHILPHNRGPVAAQHAGVLVRHLPLPVADRLGWVVTRITTPGLRSHGLPRPRTGLLTRVVRDGKIPVLDHGIVGAIRAGTVRPVAALARLDGSDAVLVDGSRFAVDAVVAATGYRRGLELLVGGLGVLDGRGRPRGGGGRPVPGAPGLWFIGYTDPISGMLREIRIEARRLARTIAATSGPSSSVP
ncbi:hypothetical protein [Occultella kanbiaonis]|uniref:hypothetical protein n=1 Tax=Occultella kanbiaonis TaxID=2675754 RepID=UPI0013D84784|nr:hypothetical protein [Occultella kanbiaonis]